MQTWICLTSRAFDSDGAKVVVNAGLIELIEPHELGACLRMSSGKLVVVQEDMRAVLDHVSRASGIAAEG